MESGIQETFARGIRNLKNICSWKLTGIEKIFARGIRNLENICPWNPESRKYLLVESGIQGTFARRIRYVVFLPIFLSRCISCFPSHYAKFVPAIGKIRGNPEHFILKNIPYRYSTKLQK